MAAGTSNGRWQLAPHLQMLDRELLRAATTPDVRLIVTMPPRHGKSELISRFLPAWYLGHFPDKKVILSGYGQQFASRWGRYCRDFIADHGQELFGIRLRRGETSATEWGIDGHEGAMSVSGVNGPITGKGADLLIIDDPIKDAAEANSAVYRESLWEWWQKTARTRLHPGGSVIVMHTRWHTDDLVGRLLKSTKEGGEQWDLLNLPARAEAGDPLGREIDAPLWPEMYGDKELEALRRSVGTDGWLSLYQQRPVKEGGNKIKATWFRYWERHGDYLRLFDAEGNFKLIEYSSLSRFVIVDAAGSSEDVRDAHKGKHSWSVAQHWGITRQGKEIALICLDQIRGQWEFPDLKHRVREFIDTHKPAWSGAEDEKTGRALNQELKRSGYTIKSISHEGKDKLTRAARLLVLLENGQVFYPRGAKWLEDYREECVNWTGDKDDQADQIDASAYAALQTVSSSMGSWGGVVNPRQTGLRYGMAF